MLSNKEKRYIANKYLRSENYCLRQIYHTWSDEKEKAYNECIRRCREDHGDRFRIISANVFSFSCGYQIIDSKTGEILGLRYITRYASYFIEPEFL